MNTEEHGLREAELTRARRGEHLQHVQAAINETKRQIEHHKQILARLETKLENQRADQLNAILKSRLERQDEAAQAITTAIMEGRA